MATNTHGKRLARAILIVAAITLFAPASTLALEPTATAAQSAQCPEALHAADIVRAADPLATLDAIETTATTASSALPAYFEEEIGLLDGAHDARSNATGSVVSYALDQDAAQAGETLRAHMAAAGWREVPLGQDNGATYVKSGGRCTWALATCEQVGDATCVVYRCVTT